MSSPVPSPVPAGTERAAVIEALLKHQERTYSEAGFVNCTCGEDESEELNEVEFATHQADAVLAVLAAVVSSSPATPPCDRPHVVPVDERDDEWECTHEWIHEGYEYRCERCGVVNGAASSPATPEGGEEAERAAMRAADYDDSPVIPACRCGDFGCDGRCRCPACQAPSPASPAETREGAAYQRGKRDAYAEAVAEFETWNLVEMGDLIDWLRDRVAASPAVSLPGEQPGGDEACGFRGAHQPHEWEDGTITCPGVPALPGERADEEPDAFRAELRARAFQRRELKRPPVPGSSDRTEGE